MLAAGSSGGIGEDWRIEAAVRGRIGRLIWALLSFCLLFSLATTNLNGFPPTMLLSHNCDDLGTSNLNLSKWINQRIDDDKQICLANY